ncbi:hypothetical protein [Microtetraspora sp. NBRC 13810]|uniref:hypothetical protein n=1 Tax=Microtetraspora sp. NBRC 13810 TaxID=3030990 RepID=UPI0025535BD8|nr:hypothetical protein [Microtetraspora sp. NBRC 13810]
METQVPSAGRVLTVVTVVPALALAGWLVAGLPLLLLGWYTPLPALLLGVPVAAAFCWYGIRPTLPTTGTTGTTGTIKPTGTTGTAKTSTTSTTSTTAVNRAGDGVAGRVGGWGVVWVVVVAVGGGVFNAVFHAEQLMVRRDPATYAQYAMWVAGHGSLPIPYQEAAFGGPDPALDFASIGFYDFHGAVVPQFMPGLPLVLVVGHWLGGVTGLLLTPPVLGALAVLTLAGTAARLVGPGWAAPAALTAAVSLPVLYTSRTSYSEILSLIMLFGGLSLLLDARRARAAVPVGGGGGAARIALLAGLVLGLATLVRIDGLRDVLPALVYAGLLLALRRAAARPGPVGEAGWGTVLADGRLGGRLLGGLVAGVGAAFLAGWLVARPYLAYLWGSLLPLLLICAAVLVAAALGVWLAPRLAGAARRAAGSRLVRWAPGVAAAAVVLVMAAFAVRPWLQTVRRVPTTPEDAATAQFIGVIQRANGLPVDETRLYYENSLHWVIWYVGIPVVVLATLAAAVLTHRLVRGREPGWLLPLAIIGWTTVTTLYRPAITPDHPFASRRLVPIVVPGLILLAFWGLRLLRESARRWYGPRAGRAVLVAGGVLVLFFPAFTSGGTAFTPVERGEAAAVSRLCAAIPRDASVLVVERVTNDRFTPIVRGMCGVPAAEVRIRAGADVSPGADVRRLVERTRAAGRRPVLMAAERDQLTPYAATPRHALTLRTRQDERSLTSAPDTTWTLSADVWLATP